MKRFIFMYVLVFGGITALAQSKIDTTYYDNNWKGIASPAFATYYRVFMTNENPQMGGRYKDYWLDGVLCGEGMFYSIDKENAERSIFNGECIKYFRNGKIQSRKKYLNKKLNGKCTEFSENGLVLMECSYKNGKLHGIKTEFLKNGGYKQVEYEDGYPKTDYYYLGNPQGQMARYRFSDNSIYWEQLTENDRKVIYRNGQTWQYYSQNGLTVAMTNSYSNDYGKWFKLDIIITNDSTEPIVFDPYYGITAYCMKNDKLIFMDVWSSSQYLSKVRKRQNTGEFFMALGEAASNYNAGYSTSTTTTNQLYGGQINSSGVGAAVGAYSGSNGYGVGASVGVYAGQTSYMGGTTTTSTTVTYDANVAFQQRALSAQRMAALSNANWEERQAIEKGYFEKTTIYPGETISGHVYVARKSGDSMKFIFEIENIKYQYGWTY